MPQCPAIMSRQPPSSPWSNEANVCTLKTMLLKGFSASQIATAIGSVTRNAVIGRAHRTGLLFKKTRNTTIRPPRVRAKQADDGTVKLPKQETVARSRTSAEREAKANELCLIQRKILAANKVEVPPPEIGAKPCNIIGLEERGCRWPLGGDPKKPGEFLYCGAARALKSTQPKTYHSCCGYHYVLERRGPPAAQQHLKQLRMQTMMAAEKFECVA